LTLSSDDGIQQSYNDLIEKVGELGIESWLETRKQEFYERYPEFISNNQ
jgi:hypothetical protein